MRVRTSDLRAAVRSAARQAGMSLEEWIEEALEGGLDLDEPHDRYRHAAEDRTARSLLNRRLDLIEDMLGELADNQDRTSDPNPTADEIVGQLAGIFNRRQGRRSGNGAQQLASLLGEDLPISRNAASDALRSISERLDRIAAKTPGVPESSGGDGAVRRIEEQLNELAGRIDAQPDDTAAAPQAHGSADAVIDKHILRLEQKLDAMAAQFEAHTAANDRAGDHPATATDGNIETACQQPLDNLNLAVDQILARQQAIESGLAGMPEAAAAQTSRFEAEAESIRGDIHALSRKIDATNAAGTDDIGARLQTLLSQIDTATRSELAEMRGELAALAAASERAINENARRQDVADQQFARLSEQIGAPAQNLVSLENKVAALAEILARAPEAQAGLGADLAARIDALAERISRASAAGAGPDQGQLADLDGHLTRLGGDITHLRNNSVGRDLLTEVFDRIAGQIDAVNARIDGIGSNQSAPVVETLCDKIDQLHVQLNQMASAGHVDDAGLTAVQQRIEELGHRLDQKAAEGTDAAVLGDIQSRIDDLARRADAAAGSMIDPNAFHALESRITEMAQQVSAISQGDGGEQSEMLQGLSRQIAHLAGQVESQGGDSGASEIKAALSELATRIDSARAQAVDAAREAAQEALAQGGGGSALVSTLKADLEALQAANSQANTRTEQSLSDMRTVLTSIVGRISEMDAGGAPGTRIEPSFAAASPSAPPQDPAAASDTPPAPRSGDLPGPMGASAFAVGGEDPTQTLKDAFAENAPDELLVREGASQARPDREDADRERIGNRLGQRINQMLGGDLPASAQQKAADLSPEFEPQDEPIVAGIDGDTPLSPGSREPKDGSIAALPNLDHMLGDEKPVAPGATEADGSAGMSGQASASDFIAAARQAAAQARNDDAGRRRKPKKAAKAAPAATPTKGSPLGRMRKPIVLASAALLLVAGSLKVYEMLQGEAPSVSVMDLDGGPDDALNSGTVDEASEPLPEAIAPPGAAGEAETNDDVGPGDQSSLPAINTIDETTVSDVTSVAPPTEETPNRASRTVGTGFVPLAVPNAAIDSAPDSVQPPAAVFTTPEPSDVLSGAEDTPLTTGAIGEPAVTQSVSSHRIGETYVPNGFAGNEQGSGIFNDTLPEAIGTSALRLAAQDGDPIAQYEVARRFAEGSSIPQDLEAAADWYQRAAAQGLAPAQYALATLYEKGNGLDQDVAMAEMWYQRAADQGNRKAMYNLAVMLSAGAKGAPDFEGAARWFRQAAELGLRDSQFNLGVMHARGMGVKLDTIEAYKWFAVAAAQGDNEAAKHRDDIAAKLDDDERARADEIATTWRPARLSDEANFVKLPARLTRGELPPDPGLQIAQDPEVVLRATQTLLNRLGYNAGPPDGIMGPRTRTAIRSFERSIGWPETGRASPRLLNRMKQATN